MCSFSGMKWPYSMRFVTRCQLAGKDIYDVGAGRWFSPEWEYSSMTHPRSKCGSHPVQDMNMLPVTWGRVIPPSKCSKWLVKI